MITYTHIILGTAAAIAENRAICWLNQYQQAMAMAYICGDSFCLVNTN